MTLNDFFDARKLILLVTFARKTKVSQDS